VVQTSQGLAKFLLEVDAERASSRGVVVASDARHNSKKYSSLVVNALLGAGIKVLWLGNQCVTPLVAFATKWYGAAAGVMITASHVGLHGQCCWKYADYRQNPASDNGYKVLVFFLSTIST
jgi:phosphoglucomutase